ncbi:MAG TPA: S8 family serine peptidase [Planctomycetota bacterium]|nr:S8 family serine peptidase [Planctomycetota bacterium]
MSSIERALGVSLRGLRRRRLAPVQVAVVDSGMDATHPALRGRVKEAWKVVTRGEAARAVKVSRARNNDAYGHGTAVAGIIAAIAPNARLLDVRVLDAHCQGGGPALLAGFEQAIASGARLINLSLACVAEFAPQLHELCERAYRGNQIVIAARRNMPLADNGFPAEFSSCISVDMADFASPFVLDFLDPPPIEFAARGEHVRVPAAGGGHTYMTGTSFATPAVTGLCALLVGAYPDLRLFELKSLLKHAARRSRRRRAGP